MIRVVSVSLLCQCTKKRKAICWTAKKVVCEKGSNYECYWQEAYADYSNIWKPTDKKKHFVSVCSAFSGSCFIFNFEEVMSKSNFHLVSILPRCITHTFIVFFCHDHSNWWNSTTATSTFREKPSLHAWKWLVPDKNVVIYFLSHFKISLYET